MMQSARLENNGEIPRRDVIARSTDGIRKRREQVDRQRPAALPRPSPQRLFRGCTGTEHRQSAPLAYARASQAADISNTAARSFNRAMRATYFSLATVAWLLGPVPLLVATALTIAVLYRREFASQSREIMQRVPPNTET